MYLALLCILVYPDIVYALRWHVMFIQLSQVQTNYFTYSKYLDYCIRFR